MQPDQIPNVAFRPIIYLLLLCAPFLFSCNNNDNGVFIPVPKDTSALGRIDHFIPLEQIKNYQAAFNKERDSLLKIRPGFNIPFSEAFNKQALIEILQIPECVGVKVLYGIKQNGDTNSMRLILVGVDSRGNNLYLTNGTTRNNTIKKSPAADSGAAKATTENSGDDSGGIEQGQCDPPCTHY